MIRQLLKRLYPALTHFIAYLRRTPNYRHRKTISPDPDRTDKRERPGTDKRQKSRTNERKPPRTNKRKQPRTDDRETPRTDNRE